MDYYKKKLFIAQVNVEDKIEGKIERWVAHEKGILHRGYTVILTFEGKYLLQQKKHPIFNRFYDLSYSSHQVFINNKLQDDSEAIYDGLLREWNLTKDCLIGQLIKNGQFYYKAKDPKSKYIEHEIDYIYQAQLKKLPRPNLDFAFGYKLMDRSKIFTLSLAPWVKLMFNNKLIK